MADTPEVTVTGSPWQSWFQDLTYMAGIRDAIAGAFASQSSPSSDAFAPPMPTVLPEVIVTPPKPSTPAPAPKPDVIAPGVTRLLPWFGLIVPMPSGPPGTGDLPDEFTTIQQRYDPPPPPPPIEPVFDYFEPPNWEDLGKGGDERLLDPIRPPGLPVPAPPVELPDNLKFFDVSPPQPDTISLPNLWSFPDVGPDPYFSPSPGPRPAPAPASPPRELPVDPFADPELDPFAPSRRPEPGTRGTPAPDVFAEPLPDVFGYPIGDPFPAPDFRPAPAPDPANPDRNVPRVDAPLDPVTLTPALPDPFFNPGDLIPDNLVPRITPDTFMPTLADPDLPTPPQKTDRCNCPKPKKPKKKKKKESQPRSVCYRGTYTQRERGITFTPKEQVPCEPKKKAKRPKVSTKLPDIFSSFNL